MRDDNLQREGLAQDMSEPRVDDDIAMGYGEICERCDEMERFCVCTEHDTLEEMEGLK